MSSKFNVYLGLKDPSLKEGLSAQFANDWTSTWNVVDALRTPSAAATAIVAVVDEEETLELFGKSTTIIFAGTPSVETAARCFQSIEKRGDDGKLQDEELYKAVKLAFAYRETTRQNIESLYPPIGDSAPLEIMAQSLTARLHELQQLSDMRLSLIDQLPVGILGVDDEGIVVLANPKAIALLGMEDIPIWGLTVDALFKGQATEFMKDKSAEELKINVYGQQIVLRKSPFLLEKRQAGTILTLLRP